MNCGLTDLSSHLKESVFRNPGTFSWWNLESWTWEFGKQLKDSGIPLKIGIRSPRSTDKASGIQKLESVIHSAESRIQSCLGFPYMERGLYREEKCDVTLPW